ncbi:Metallo-dependent phosphatase-like protein [Entophlyctis helioformis]|nr:Metallo-dependent phosphatase-like protein [Entophlyctis helioformis]
MQRSLRFLVVGDVHGRIDCVNGLKAWLRHSKTSIDASLVSGDLLNLPDHSTSAGIHAVARALGVGARSAMGAADLNDPQARATAAIHAQLEQKQSKDFAAMLNALRPLAPQLFFVPGNHDPWSVVSRLPSSGADATSAHPSSDAGNVHRTIRPVAPGLRIGGVGGSTTSAAVDSDATPTSNPIPGLTHDPASIIDPALDNLFRRIQSEPEGSYITMTHAGPSLLGTAVVDYTPWQAASAKDTGNRRLRSLLASQAFQPPDRFASSQGDKPRAHIVFHVHGHAHHSWGVSQLGAIPVINAGPLRDGRFAIVTLRPSNSLHERLRWTFESVSMHTLHIDTSASVICNGHDGGLSL